MTPDSPTLYEVLGVAPDATDTQLKTAWRLAAKATHPDAGGVHHRPARLGSVV